MKALRFDGSKVALADADEPEPKPGEARVRVRIAGICNTDVEIARGYMGFAGTLGHEMIGEVVEAPDAAWIGKRVASEINLACESCAWCGRGLGRHCPNRTVLGILGKDGCFAQHVTLPLANLHEVPAEVPDESASFVEPLAAAHEIAQLVPIDPDARVLVLGDGKLGLLCAMALRDTGCDLTVVGKHDRKLGIMRSLGVPVATPDGLAEGSYDIVVEATGSPSGLDLALSRVQPRGTLVLKSTYHGAPELDTAKVVVDEIKIVGTRCGPFPPAIRALAQTRMDPRPLVDATYPLADAERAFQHAQEPGILKVLLDMR